MIYISWGLKIFMPNWLAARKKKNKKKTKKNLLPHTDIQIGYEMYEMKNEMLKYQIKAHIVSDPEI